MANSDYPWDFGKMQMEDHNTLIGMKVSLDSYIIEARQARADDTVRYTDHEARIRSLENKQEQHVGSEISRKEIIAWVTLAALIMGAIGWIPGLLGN